MNACPAGKGSCVLLATLARRKSAGRDRTAAKPPAGPCIPAKIVEGHLSEVESPILECWRGSGSRPFRV